MSERMINLLGPIARHLLPRISWPSFSPPCHRHSPGHRHQLNPHHSLQRSTGKLRSGVVDYYYLDFRIPHLINNTGNYYTIKVVITRSEGQEMTFKKRIANTMHTDLQLPVVAGLYLKIIALSQSNKNKNNNSKSNSSASPTNVCYLLSLDLEYVHNYVTSIGRVTTRNQDHRKIIFVTVIFAHSLRSL